jgi:hypothetical protein
MDLVLAEGTTLPLQDPGLIGHGRPRLMYLINLWDCSTYPPVRVIYCPVVLEGMGRHVLSTIVVATA